MFFSGKLSRLSLILDNLGPTIDMKIFRSIFRRIHLVITAFLLWAFNRISCRNVLPAFVSNFFEKGRMTLLRAQGMKGGYNAFIRTNFWCNKLSNLSIGDRGTIAINCQFYAYAKITIGNNFLIGSDLIIHTAEHNFSRTDIPIIDQGSNYKPVTIGDNVYIGSRVTILPGVVIEDNVIVGAGSVINKNLESGYFYAGVPAKKIKSIFELTTTHS